LEILETFTSIYDLLSSTFQNFISDVMNLMPLTVSLLQHIASHANYWAYIDRAPAAFFDLLLALSTFVLLTSFTSKGFSIMVDRPEKVTIKSD
jgi:hypothetical protein